MDIIVLEDVLKKDARRCFEDFKYSLLNNPFNIIDECIVNACVESEINQSFGSKVYNRFLHKDITEVQYNYLIGEIKKYKDLTLRTALNFGNMRLTTTKNKWLNTKDKFGKLEKGLGYDE